MSRVSTVVLGAFVAVLATTAGCKVSVETKTRYTLDNQLIKDDLEYNGEPIEIRIEGVGAAVNGGVRVDSDPSTKQITANARFLAMAFSDHKADADLSLADVKARFKITHDATGIHVTCDHGDNHGDSESGSSGCELTNIVIPAGTQDKPLKLTALSGNGGLTLQLANAYVGSVLANSNGADSSINAEIAATQGGVISLVSKQGDDVSLTLPTGASANSVQLVADLDKIGVGPFTTLTTYDGSQGIGTADAGLASIKITSESFAGETGHIDLQSR